MYGNCSEGERKGEEGRLMYLVPKLGVIPLFDMDVV